MIYSKYNMTKSGCGDNMNKHPIYKCILISLISFLLFVPLIGYNGVKAEENNADLTIKTETTASKSGTFNFKIKIWNGSDYLDLSDQGCTAVEGEEGTYAFSLTNNAEKIFTGIPLGYRYEVTEETESGWKLEEISKEHYGSTTLVGPGSFIVYIDELDTNVKREVVYESSGEVYYKKVGDAEEIILEYYDGETEAILGDYFDLKESALAGNSNYKAITNFKDVNYDESSGTISLTAVGKDGKEYESGVIEAQLDDDGNITSVPFYITVQGINYQSFIYLNEDGDEYFYSIDLVDGQTYELPDNKHYKLCDDSWDVIKETISKKIKNPSGNKDADKINFSHNELIFKNVRDTQEVIVEKTWIDRSLNDRPILLQLNLTVTDGETEYTYTQNDAIINKMGNKWIYKFNIDHDETVKEITEVCPDNYIQTKQPTLNEDTGVYELTNKLIMTTITVEKETISDETEDFRFRVRIFRDRQKIVTPYISFYYWYEHGEWDRRYRLEFPVYPVTLNNEVINRNLYIGYSHDDLLGTNCPDSLFDWFIELVETFVYGTLPEQEKYLQFKFTYDGKTYDANLYGTASDLSVSPDDVDAIITFKMCDEGSTAIIDPIETTVREYISFDTYSAFTKVEGEEGLYEFTVTAGTPFILPMSIPGGYQYEIYELEKEGWTLVSIDDDETLEKASGIIESEDEITHTFLNARTNLITINKEVIGSDADKEKEYEFTIKADRKLNHELLTNEQETAEKDKTYYTYDFTLKHDGSLKINAPHMMEYEVSEKDYSQDNIKTTANDKETNTINGKLEEDVEINYVNEVIKRYSVFYRYEGDLPKEVLDTLPSDSNKYPSATVITAKAPFKTEIKVSDGKWVFIGWDMNKKTIIDSDIIFVGRWKKINDTNLSSNNVTRYVIPRTGIE